MLMNLPEGMLVVKEETIINYGDGNKLNHYDNELRLMLKGIKAATKEHQRECGRRWWWTMLISYTPVYLERYTVHFITNHAFIHVSV